LKLSIPICLAISLKPYYQAMPTRNTKLLSNRESRPSSPKNPVAKKSLLSKNNIPLKFSQHNKRRAEEQTRPQTLTSKNPKKAEENGTLRIKDANKTTLISSSICNTNQSVAIKAPEGATHQRHAAKKLRDKYSLAKKNQDSDGNRVSFAPNYGKDRRIVRKHLKSNSFRPLRLILLNMLNFLSVVQALTDCQIMHAWLPAMFDGSGSACCSQTGITCYWGGLGSHHASVCCIN
jgi:hypothetical protein